MVDTLTPTQEAHRLIASDRVEGTRVYNRAGDKLGSIKNFMVGKLSGQVEYAVIEFGGILGMGSDFYPIPWDMLHYDTDKGGYVVDLDRSRLEGAPHYTSANEPNWSDRAYGQRLCDALRALFGMIHRRGQLPEAQFQARLAAARDGVLRAGTEAWWHRYWQQAGLMRLTSADGAAQYFENVRMINLYADAAERGSSWPGSQAGVADLFDSSKRSRGYGLYFTIYLGSGAISPSLYGLVGDAMGLASVFVAMTLVSLAIVPLAGLYYLSRRPSQA